MTTTNISYNLVDYNMMLERLRANMARCKYQLALMDITDLFAIYGALSPAERLSVIVAFSEEVAGYRNKLALLVS